MKKQLFIFAAALALGAVACNKLTPEAETPSGVQEEITAPARVWKVSVNAVKGTGTKALELDELNKKILTSFSTTDMVYVYNKTKGALDASCLSPLAAGETATLYGELTGDYAVGDVLELRYDGCDGVNGPGVFDYESQTGDFDTLRDYGVATVNVTAVDTANGKLTLEDAAFTNPYSIFRFTFVDQDTYDPIPISLMWVKAAFGKLVCQDSPDGTRMYYGPMDMLAGTFPKELWRDGSTAPVWLALCYEQPDSDPTFDFLTFNIEDEVHKIVYDMVKPTDGKIVNSKFYSPTIEMMALPKPEVTLTASGDPVEPSQLCGLYEVGNYYTYINPGKDITVGGESGDQCRFSWNFSSGGSATMRFKDPGTGDPQFFVCDNTTFVEHLASGPFTFVLDGKTEIIGGDKYIPIKVDNGYREVVFKGSGTLTITGPNTFGTKGIQLADAGGNPKDGVPNVHAATGYTLVVSDGIDNGNGTSTWTYLVYPGDSSLPVSTFTLEPPHVYNDSGNPFASSSPGSGSISTNWEIGDKVWVCYDSTSSVGEIAEAVVTSVDGSGYATISAFLNNPLDGSDISFGHPFRHWNEGLDPHDGQTGTLSNVTNIHAATFGLGTISVTAGKASIPLTVGMDPELSIWQLTFTDGTMDLTFGIDKLTISLGPWDEYTVIPTMTTYPFYVALYPNDDVTVTITAETPHGTYTASKSGVTFEAGKLYTSYNLALTKKP